MKATRPVTLATLRSFRDREGSTGDQPGAPRWLAISVGIAAVTVALVLWQALLVHERADAHRMIEEQASDLRTEMQDLIELRILALVRMAKHWEMERGTPKEEWEADAALYVAHDSSYQAIEWVDPSFHVRWIVPLEGNEAALDLDLAFEERRRVALEVAREQREVTLTRTADLVQGDKGLLAYVPLFPGGDFHGFILGVFRVAKLLDAILAEKIALGYSVAVFDGEEEIYSRYDAQRQHEEEWAQEMEVDIHNVTWRVRMWPRSEWLTKAQSPLPHVVLAVGLVMGVLLTLTVHLAQTAQRRTREVQRANEELEEENTQRTRAEEELRALTGTLEQRVVERTKEVEARRREAESLAEVGQLISQSLDPAEVGQRVVGSVRGLLGIQMSVLYRLDLESEDLVALASSGAAKPSFEWDLTLPRGAGLSGLAVRERQPVATPDILTDPRVEYTPDARSHLGRATYRAALAVPLVVKDRVVGALAVGDRAGRVFTDEEIRLAQTFADQAAVAVENARLYEQARSTRDFLHSITENSADAIITTDIRGRITYFSPGAEEIFGYQAEEILGRPAAEYYRSGPEEARAVMDRLRADTQVRNHEAAFRHKDGRWVETNASISLLRDTSGAIVGVVGVVKDITERKQLEKELIRSERVWAVGEMAAGVAHNFNNLLAVVLGRAQLLLLQLGEKKLQLGDVQRNLVVIERAALNGAATVRRLLEFTRDTPRPGEAVTVDVEELLTHTVELARHRWKDEAEAQGRPIEVVLEPGAVPPAAGTPAELQEVLLSLVLNAIDAMPQGGTLTLSSWAEDGSVCLGVKDTGLGIPEEVQSRIFEPFFTTKGPQSTGLGLSVCYGIMSRNEGEITVDSRPGQGTTFTIKLPARGAPAPRVDPRATPQGERLRILIIDDEADVRAIFRDIAEAGGHEVCEAESGAEGLELLERQPVDLVCTDLGMPGMTGWQVADRVKVRWPELPVALITGWGARVAPEELGAHGVDLLITKPFQAKALLRALSDFRPLADSRCTPELLSRERTNA